MKSAWIELPHPDEDFAANPVELFFDLAFVFAFSQLVGRLVHDPNAEGIAKTGLLFLVLWLPWTQFTWAANATSGHTRQVQSVVLVATAASVPMAAAVTTAFGDGGKLFAFSMIVILAMGLVLMLAAYPTDSPAFYSALRYTTPNMVAMAFIGAGSCLEEGPRITLWGLGVVSVVYATVRAVDGPWVVRPGHFAERHGLIVIVALGEVIVAIAIPVLSRLEEAQGLPGDTVIALAGAAAFASLLWWAYFDRPQGLWERRLAEETGPGRARFARDVYTYVHALIVAGVIVSAAALEEVTLHPGDALHSEFRIMLFVGLALFFGGIEVGVRRAFRMFPPERATAIVVLGIFLLTASDMRGVVILIVVDVIIFFTLLAEAFRVERPNGPTLSR
jgi:low temperature requirement protein LtrA